MTAAIRRWKGIIRYKVGKKIKKARRIAWLGMIVSDRSTTSHHLRCDSQKREDPRMARGWQFSSVWEWIRRAGWRALFFFPQFFSPHQRAVPADGKRKLPKPGVEFLLSERPIWAVAGCHCDGYRVRCYDGRYYR